MPSKVIVKNNFALIDPLVRAAAAEVLTAAAHEMDAEIKQSFGEPKSGREYKRGGKTHRASAPGEAPAVDTGNLQNSNHAVTDEARTALRTEVVNDAEYALAQERGTARQAPRPFMTKAAENQRERLPRRMAAAVKKATDQARVQGG